MPYPEGESSARQRSMADARASRSEHFAQGIDTAPASVMTTRASGVGSMALARTGWVSLCIAFSKVFSPGCNDLVEMLKDNPPDLAPQRRSTVVLKFLHDIESIREQPTFALGFSLSGVNVHRLFALVRIKDNRQA